MDDDPDFTEPSVTARERALQEKIIRLEKRLEGYLTEIGNTLKCTHNVSKITCRPNVAKPDHS